MVIKWKIQVIDFSCNSGPLNDKQKTILDCFSIFYFYFLYKGFLENLARFYSNIFRMEKMTRIWSSIIDIIHQQPLILIVFLIKSINKINVYLFGARFYFCIRCWSILMRVFRSGKIEKLTKKKTIKLFSTKNFHFSLMMLLYFRVLLWIVLF